MKALGLDPSMRRIGWAVGSTDGSRPVWGVLRSPSWGKDEGDHLNRVSNWLDEQLANYRFEACFYEAVFISTIGGGKGGTDAIRAKIMLEGEILKFAARHKLKVFDVPLQSWRSRFLGATQAPPHYRQKPEMARNWLKQRAIKACAERGWLTDSDDEAEALGILDYGLACLDTAYQGRTDTIFRRREFEADRGAA